MLQDESAELQNKLKMAESKIGNGEETKALLEFDAEPFPDKVQERKSIWRNFQNN